MRAIFNARLAACVLLCLPYAALILWLTRVQDLHSVAAMLASVGLMQLLLAFAARNFRWFLLLQFPLVMLSAAFSAYTLTYNIPPGRAIAFVLATSSWEEIRGFFGIWEGVRLALAGFAFAAAYLILACLTPPVPFARGSSAARWGAIGAIVLSSAYGAANSAAFIDGIAVNPVVGTALFFAGPLHDAKAVINGTGIGKIPYHASRVGGEEVHILVIGESSRRDSWSVYGYGRKTTPFMEKLGGEAIFFERALADANLTVYAVPILLTGVHPAAFNVGAFTGSFVDLAHEAGYSTAWMMNQDAGPSMLVGIHADRMIYANGLSALASGHTALDEALLPPLRAAVGQTGRPRFIGLHIMGSHWQYYDRYPPAFDRFGPTRGLNFISAFSQHADQRIVNAYDNSVAYTDWFLGQVIAEARKLTVPATVTYFSDHGEDIYTLDGRAGHGTATYSKHQYEIPAFVWTNSAYRAAHPEKVQALIRNSTLQVRSHNVFYSVADLMGIRWPGASAVESFASDAFVPDLSPQFIAGGPLVSRSE
jgi:glucan phosphoethanolaminetransferase (alkaline phosphatase superfamily)